MLSEVESDKLFNREPSFKKSLGEFNSAVWFSETDKKLFTELILQRLVKNNGFDKTNDFIKRLIENVGNDNNLCKIEFAD